MPAHDQEYELPYYAGKEASLRTLFGVETVVVGNDEIVVNGRRLAVLDDVIIALEPSKLPPALRARLGEQSDAPSTPFAADIQYSFGQEWQAHPDVLPEHADEFADYFDLIDLGELAGARVADIGCGSGRWATFVAPACSELVVVDYSEAVFVARANLRAADNVIFVMADALDLPFAPDSFDFLYCLGVLHHLPVGAREALGRLAPLASRLLVYLYYALDNRPWYFRGILSTVTAVREVLARVRRPSLRTAITWLITLSVYWPVSVLGRWLAPLGAARWLPLAEAYAGKSVRRLRQDVYDRFFTAIEQRFTRREIESWAADLGDIRVSERQPYWHFLITRR